MSVLSPGRFPVLSLRICLLRRIHAEADAVGEIDWDVSVDSTGGDGDGVGQQVR
ncbi:hypothetical protein ACIPLC_20440 [Kitasatospora sp. NPDC086801]|uniref:hypothetical protein n=1 Tax=Kitasatospora sp. NPDC086801 TaxID=3364066 RepID=UPI00381F1B47